MPAHPASDVAREEEPMVLYEHRGPLAHVTMNRPRYRDAQTGAMTYALPRPVIASVRGACVAAMKEANG
ncbi:hypothetical protein ABT143_28285 [Streptomyces sp. NPDC002033]|uniref:hypothetical protein n=1 Tax=unclassified Streptomyces TaxID=2593676 RepID=UPI00331990DE